MIDTLTVTTTDFEIDMLKNQSSEYPLTRIKDWNDNPLERVSQNNFLMFDKNHNPIYGNGLTLARTSGNEKGTLRNTGIVKIGPFQNPKNGVTDIHLSIQSSIPKYLYKGENFYLADKSDLFIYKKELESELSRMGIYTSVENMNVSRMDMTKNAKTQYPFSTYIPVLKMCNATRNISSEINASTYNTGPGKGLTKLICCYDKIQEIENSGLNLPHGITTEDNIFRCEYRMLKKKSIQEVGILNYKDLENNYQDMKTVYKESVKKYLFGNFQQNQKSIENKRLYDIESIAIQSMKNTSKWVNQFIFDVGIYASQEVYIQLYDNLSMVLELESEKLAREGKSQEYIRLVKHRHKKQLQEKLSEVLTKLDNNFGIPYTQLYEELENLLLVA